MVKFMNERNKYSKSGTHSVRVFTSLLLFRPRARIPFFIIDLVADEFGDEILK